MKQKIHSKLKNIYLFHLGIFGENRFFGLNIFIYAYELRSDEQMKKKIKKKMEKRNNTTNANKTERTNQQQYQIISV